MIVWNRSYTIDDVTRGIAVRRASDDPNGFVMLGHTDTIDGLAPSIFVMRTDSLGNPLWTNTYGRGLGREFDIKCEIRTLANGYIVTGTVNSPTEGGMLGYLLRIDASGAMLWMNFYRLIGPAFDETRLHDVRETATGFVMTGSGLSQAPPSGFQNAADTLIITTDLVGNVIWAKQYADTMGSDYGRSLALTLGGYAVVGERAGIGIPTTQLLEVDLLGNVNWIRQVDLFVDGGSNSQNGESNGSLEMLPTGELVFPGGNLSNQAALLKFDPFGNLVDSRAYDASVFQQGACAIPETGAGGMTFVGPRSEGISNDYYLVRTDANLLTNCKDVQYTPTIITPPVLQIDLAYLTLPVQEIGPAFPVVEPLVWVEEVVCQSNDCLDAVPLTCSVSGTTVNITWPPFPATTDFAELYRDGVLLGVVTGTSFADVPPFGTHTYELRLYDIDPGCPTASSFCTVTTGFTIPVIDITDVIAVPWKPVIDGPVICWNDHLVSLGRNSRIASDLDLVTPDLGTNVPGVTPVVWLSLGQFPESYTLTQDDGQVLAAYLGAGGSLYIEGGDVAFGNQTVLAQLDGAIAIDDGALDGTVPGLTGFDSGLGLDASGLSAPYGGSGLRVDHLAPDGPGAAAILENSGGAGQTTAVFYDAAAAGAGTHRVVTSSTLLEDYGGDMDLFLDVMLAGLSPPVVGDVFLRSDANGDGIVDIADPIYGLAYLFTGGPSVCIDAQDVNDDGEVNIADPVYSLAYTFSGGPPPLAPWPDCGVDPTGDGLDCAGMPTCP